MGAHGGGAAAVHLDDVQEAVVHRAVGQVGIADARGAPRGRRLHRHNIPSLIVNKRTLNVSSSSSFPPEGQALKTASKVHQQGHSSGRRVGGSRSGSCLASQCRPQGEASRTRAAAPTCAGGVAFGGRVVPGGMTLWPTWVVVTAVQLLVKDMGAVFSRTCISQQCTHHLPLCHPLDVRLRRHSLFLEASLTRIEQRRRLTSHTAVCTQQLNAAPADGLCRRHAGGWVWFYLG